MRTIVTDRYAVKVWLPCSLGMLELVVWIFDSQWTKRDLIVALIWLASAGLAFWQRQRKPRELR